MTPSELRKAEARYQRAARRAEDAVRNATAWSARRWRRAGRTPGSRRPQVTRGRVGQIALTGAVRRVRAV